VTVAVVGSRVEAELVVGSLRSHGIHAMVSADDAGGVDLALQAQGVRVLVPEKDLAAARRILGDDSGSSKPLNVLQRWLVRLLGGRER
jgi:Putative prokaryotic signal transducing protein